MMVEEKHYADDSLIALASAPVAMDEHLAACRDCNERLETYRLIAEAMEDKAIWDTRPLSDAPVPETIANLRGFADRMAIEDVEAAQLLPDLLAGQREQWMSTLHHHPEYRTAGMVRKLLEAVPTALDIMPRDAVELTALAIEIADNLETATPQLRGAAWRERAYALFYTGDFVSAERALCASERHFTESVANEYDLARVGVVRALVERGLERFTEAGAAAHISAAVFARFEDLERFASARLAETHLLYSVMDFSTALGMLHDLERRLANSPHSHTHALVLENIGCCLRKLGRIPDALTYLEAAAASLTFLGINTEAVRARWTVAAILAEEGRFDEALSTFEAVCREFQHLGMAGDETLAALEIAEIMLTRGEGFDHVQEICRAAIDSFQTAGLAHTARALTALALAREAAANRTVTPMLIHSVRDYIRRLPAEPNLVFAQLPQ